MLTVPHTSGAVSVHVSEFEKASMAKRTELLKKYGSIFLYQDGADWTDMTDTRGAERVDQIIALDRDRNKTIIWKNPGT